MDCYLQAEGVARAGSRSGFFQVLLWAIAIPGLVSWQAAAQTSAPQPGQAPASDPSSGARNSGASDQKPSGGTSKDRLFFTLPNFLTLENANAGKVPPLTAKQKFKVVARSAFDPVEFFWYGALAGISQAGNSEPGFGQGLQGYGKRYGSYFADGTIENFMTSALLPSLLHQDPRYFQMGKGGFWRRTGYAVSHILITRSDRGAREFNFSEVLGSAASAGISTYTYHPRSDRNLDNAISVWGSQLGYDALTYVLKEFWPDIRHKFSRSHGSATGTAP
ncbi:MAG TPA: hypothetical protein VH640_08575 [Bryobacteraceae bacterium]|jgi:hypothetical protein